MFFLSSYQKNHYLCIGFLVPSRDKHHHIYDLRCLVAGNIVNGLLKHKSDAPAVAPFSVPPTAVRTRLAELYSSKLFFPNLYKLTII